MLIYKDFGGWNEGRIHVFDRAFYRNRGIARINVCFSLAYEEMAQSRERLFF